MTIMKKQVFPVKRLVMDAVLIALYIVLGLYRIPIGNTFRISVAPFAVILCALTFGPIDGLIVGFLGEFLMQLLTYGLTKTTVYWCLGEAARGLLLGCCGLGLKRWDLNSMKYFAWSLILCVVTGIVAAFGNTLALYKDSKWLGYYNYEMVFGSLLIRLAIYIIVSALLGYICIPVMKALRKAKLIERV